MKYFFCATTIAFVCFFALFSVCNNNLDRPFLLNANVTKEQHIMLWHKHLKMIYYEYDYFYENQTFKGANTRIFGDFNNALQFSNSTSLKIYVCKNNLKKSEFSEFSCDIFHQISIFLGLIVGGVGSFCAFVFFVVLTIAFCEIEQEKTTENFSRVKHKRRRYKTN